ncbi:MAG: PCRF domain-containing protein, partial [Clostridia bacterium]|nr:PCRF domain-containing protein [Clostridia bacterium]
MLDKLRLVEERYMEMAERAAQPDFFSDPKAATQLLKEQKRLEPIITAYRSFRAVSQEQQDLLEMMSGEQDAEMKELCQQEFQENKKKLEALTQELKILLLPRDPNDDKSVIMEIRGGVGGEESALFAHSLFRMYTMYAESKRWQITLLNYNETELGGIKEAAFELSGDGAYSRLTLESGVHRVQRVPAPESG